MSAKDRRKGEVSSTMEHVLLAPDKKKFEKEVNEISAKIKHLESQRRQLASQGGQSSEVNTELSRTTSDLAEIGQQKTKTTTEVRSVEDQVKKLGPEITMKKDEASKLLVGLRYKSKERIEDAVSKLRQQLLTRQFSGTEERKLESEIESLESSKDKLREYLSTKADIDRMIEEQEQLRERRNSLYRVNRELRTREGETKDKQAQLRKLMTEVRDKKRDIQAHKDSLTQEIDVVYKARQKLRDDFRRAQSDYLTASSELSQREMEERERESVRRGQERIARRRRQVLEEELRREMRYEEEKTTCKTLITHLQKLTESSTVTATSNGTIGAASATTTTASSDPQRSQSSPAVVTALAAAAPLPSTTTTATEREGAEFKKPGEFLPRKTLDDEPSLVPSSSSSSKRKSRRDKKRHAPSGKAPRRLTHDPMVLTQFEFLSVLPPTTYSTIPHVLHTLQEKLAFYDHKTATCSEAGDSGIGSQALGDVSEQELNSQEDCDPASLSSPHRHGLELTLSPDLPPPTESTTSPLTPVPVDEVKSLNHSISTSTTASTSSATHLVQVTE